MPLGCGLRFSKRLMYRLNILFCLDIKRNDRHNPLFYESDEPNGDGWDFLF